MPDDPIPVEPWNVLDTEPAYGCRIFSVRRQRSRSPRSGKVHEFHVIDSADWVNVIPLTADGRVVMIRQYRHGVGDITLEIPGGTIEADDPSPLVAARREMQEETGYDSSDLAPLGWIHPNPAIHSNRCHSFVARAAEPRFPIRGDGTEETEVVVVPLPEIPRRIRDGEITHALVVVAFQWLWLAENDAKEPMTWSG